MITLKQQRAVRQLCDNWKLTSGTIFDTPFEQDCVAVTAPDAQGNFDAEDSEGVVCQYNIVMVARTR